MTGTSPAAGIIVLWCILVFYMLNSIGSLSTVSETSQEWERLRLDHELMEQRTQNLASARNKRVSRAHRGAINTQTVNSAVLADIVDDSHHEKGCYTRGRLIVLSISFSLINAIIVLWVNIGYVVLTLSNSPMSSKILGQVGLAVFKLVWNNTVVPLCLQYFSSFIEVLSNNPAARIRLHVMVLLFNSVFAPCIAAASTGNACS